MFRYTASGTFNKIAQLVEQRIRNAWVEGSSPFFGFEPYTPKPKRKQGIRGIFMS